MTALSADLKRCLTLVWGSGASHSNLENAILISSSSPWMLSLALRGTMAREPMIIVLNGYRFHGGVYFRYMIVYSSFR